MTGKARRARGLTWILLALCLVLSLLVWGELHYGRQWYQSKIAALSGPLKAVQPAPNAEAVPALDLALPPMVAFNELVERPLFMSTRRPPEPESVVEEPPPPPAPPLPPIRATLSSIVITPNKRIALAYDHASRRQVRLEPGKTLAGWHVERIEDDQVIFAQGGQTQSLKLRDYKKKRSVRNRRSAAKPAAPRQQPKKVSETKK